MVLQGICQAIQDLLSDVSGKVQAIIVGAPGPLDTVQGIIIYAPLFQDMQNVPLLSHIEQLFGIKTWVQNDSNMAALGEYNFGAGQDSTVMVYMTVSTGIGGGIVINGQLLTGSKGFAGEIGHICVRPDGLLCGCGRRGCLEAHASGAAIEAEAYRAVHQGIVTRLQEVLSTKGTIQVEDVVFMSTGGDEVAQSILQSAATTIGIGLASLVNIFNPDCIVVGGGVSNAGVEFLDTIRSQVQVQAMSPMCEQVRIVHSQLEDEAGLYGAFSYGKQMLKI